MYVHITYFMNHISCDFAEEKFDFSQALSSKILEQ